MDPNSGLGAIQDLNHLKNALSKKETRHVKVSGTTTPKGMTAVLGKEGGRKFEINGEQVSLHEIVDRYLSLLEIADLRDGKTRLEAANILEKLQIMKDDHDFLIKKEVRLVKDEKGTERSNLIALPALSIKQTVKLGIRKIIGKIFHGSQNDLDKKFMRAIESNLTANKDHYKDVAEDIKVMMKSVSVETMLSRDIVENKRTLANYIRKINGKDHKIVGKKLRVEAEMWDLKTLFRIKDQDSLPVLVDYCDKLSLAINNSGVSTKRTTATLSKKTVDEARNKITHFQESAQLLIGVREDIRRTNKEIDRMFTSGAAKPKPKNPVNIAEEDGAVLKNKFDDDTVIIPPATNNKKNKKDKKKNVEVVDFDAISQNNTQISPKTPRKRHN